MSGAAARTAVTEARTPDAIAAARTLIRAYNAYKGSLRLDRHSPLPGVRYLEAVL